MRTFLVRRWFLLAIVCGLTFCLLWPNTARTGLDRLPAQYVVAVALFLTAWGLEARRLLRALLRPTPVLWALAMSYLALPALAWAVGVLLPILVDFRVGLLLIASVPCTLATAVLCTRASGGNEATALLVVLISTATSWIVTTAWLALTPVSDAAVDANRLMADLLYVLVLPVGIAQFSRMSTVVVRLAERWRNGIGILARLVILIVVMKAGVKVAGQSEQLTFGWFAVVVALCLGLHLAVLWLGYAGGRLLRLDAADRLAVAFAGSQKTLPVALYLFETYYPAYPLAVLPLALFQLIQLAADTTIADRLALVSPDSERVCSSSSNSQASGKEQGGEERHIQPILPSDSPDEEV